MNIRIPSLTKGATWQAIAEHGLPLLLYTLLSLALTWPMAAHFTTLIPGTTNDAHNGLWVMWHVKEALKGNLPFFDLPLVYYPHGATLLTHVPGPLVGFFALPFWPWGPEAAHNGAVLVGFVLTGYFMYWLARSLGLTRGVAFFAGVMLLVAPMHLVGLWGHTTKVFFGAIPLVLLALHRTLNLQRSPWWAVGTALALLAATLFDSWQLIVSVMAMAFFILVCGWQTERVAWPAFLKRIAVLALAITVIVGPLLLLILQAASDPTITLNHNYASLDFQPDAAEFLLPPVHTRLFGGATADLLAAHGVSQGIETNVYLSWVGLALCLLALIGRSRPGAIWLALTLIFVALSFGPVLQLLGRRHFTEYGLPVLLPPYVLLTMLPGIDFLRTPGRFMEIGYVTLAMAAAFGLGWLVTRFPRQAVYIVAFVTMLVLVEHWPQPWPLLALRPTPAFYEQLAQDEEVYGVLDLPLKPTEAEAAIVYGTHYQLYQMTHHKGIAMGYISRIYTIHPIIPCLVPDILPPQEDVLVNGRPANCLDNLLYDLSAFNYRYVVWHKPQLSYPDYQPGSWGETVSADLVERLFSDQEPMFEDEFVRVYPIPTQLSVSDLQPSLHLGSGWHPSEGDLRWASSPANVMVAVPQSQTVILEISPVALYDPGPERITGFQGVLQVAAGDLFTTSVELQVGETARIPLELPAGVHSLTLSLEAGNFIPGDYGSTDYRLLSFAVSEINLQVDNP